MKKTMIALGLVIAGAFAAGLMPSPALGQDSGSPVLVGHIDYVDGSLLRYVPETRDWVATVKDAPFGLQDALYAEQSARVEIIMPNNTLLRIGGSTQAQLLRLSADLTEIDIASGKARFYNKSPGAIMRATTPFGQVIAPAGTVFDLYVGDDSVEVLAIRGTVEYVQASGTTKYSVQQGAASLIATRSEITSGQGLADASWDTWNYDRDAVWQRRIESPGESARYVPPELHAEAYALEDSGRWDRVYYEGDYQYFWRPTYVAAGWAPYTCGRWTYWYGDNCWIPAEPFGYVTHHYGSWIYVDSARCWYWAPPVAGVVRVPAYTVGYAWYPGRVSWIYNETYIGWVPLAPYEPYYCHHHWGPAAVVVNVNVYDFDHHGRGHGDHHDGWSHDEHHGKHRYESHAVVVPQNNFYSVRNYQKAGIRTIDTRSVQSNYRSSPVVNTQVLQNTAAQRQKYNFADIPVQQKPHQSAQDRIQQNLNMAGREGRQPAETIMQRMERMKTGTPAANPQLQNRPQQVTDKLVPSRDVDMPKSGARFTKHELKPSGTVQPSAPGKGQPQQNIQTPAKPQEPQRYQRPTPPSTPAQPQEPSRYQRQTVPSAPSRPQEPSHYEHPATPSHPQYESHPQTHQQTPQAPQSQGRGASQQPGSGQQGGYQYQR